MKRRDLLNLFTKTAVYLLGKARGIASFLILPPKKFLLSRATQKSTIF